MECLLPIFILAFLNYEQLAYCYNDLSSFYFKDTSYSSNVMGNLEQNTGYVLRQICYSNFKDD